MTQFTHFKDIIELWPTCADFGRDIGITDISARAMKRRDKISSKYWDVLVRAANSKGISNLTHETLAQLASIKPQAKIKHTRSSN